MDNWLSFFAPWPRTWDRDRVFAGLRRFFVHLIPGMLIAVLPLTMTWAVLLLATYLFGTLTLLTIGLSSFCLLWYFGALGLRTTVLLMAKLR